MGGKKSVTLRDGSVISEFTWVSIFRIWSVFGANNTSGMQIIKSGMSEISAT